MISKIFIVISVTLLLAAGVMGFVCFAVGMPSLYRMANSGAQAEGWVTAKEPQNHRRVRYSFNVGGKTYQGLDGAAGKDFDTIKIGDPVTVIYDPVDPGRSMLGHPDERFADTLVVSAFFSLIGGFLVAISLTKFVFPRFGR